MKISYSKMFCYGVFLFMALIPILLFIHLLYLTLYPYPADLLGEDKGLLFVYIINFSLMPITYVIVKAFLSRDLYNGN